MQYSGDETLEVCVKHLLGNLAFVIALPLQARAAPQAKTPTIDIKTIVMTENIAKEAYIWGYPFVRFERTRKLLTTTPGFGHAPLNTFFHASRLPTPQDKNMSNPLPDTLYSSAFLDLRRQPLVLQMPKISSRFYTLHFMDASGNNIGLISSRTKGNSAGRYFISGPQYIGPTPTTFEHIRSSTNYVWVQGHIAANSATEAKSAHALLLKYSLRPYNVYLGKEKLAKPPLLTGKSNPTINPQRIADAGVRFYDELGMALKENEPSNLEPAVMKRFASIEVGPGLQTSRKTAIREMREAYERAIASAEIEISQKIRKNLIVRRKNWTYITRGDHFGKNYSLRAAMTKVYFGETNSAEAIHPVTSVDSNNVRLNGNGTYILHFDKDELPPVKAFWSLVTYNSRDKSLVENSLNRYSLGSYTKKLLFNADSSLDLYISANEPTGRTSNWLPAPRGNFYVMMNMYNPTTDAISGKYILPSLQKATVSPTLSFNK